VQACINLVRQQTVPTRIVAPIALIDSSNVDKAIAASPSHSFRSPTRCSRGSELTMVDVSAPGRLGGHLSVAAAARYAARSAWSWCSSRSSSPRPTS